jgi:hypothetical protein
VSIAAVLLTPGDPGAGAHLETVAAAGYRAWPVMGSDVIPSHVAAVYAPGRPDIEDRARIAGLIVIESAPANVPIGD